MSKVTYQGRSRIPVQAQFCPASLLAFSTSGVKKMRSLLLVLQCILGASSPDQCWALKLASWVNTQRGFLAPPLGEGAALRGTGFFFSSSPLDTAELQAPGSSDARTLRPHGKHPRTLQGTMGTELQVTRPANRCLIAS